MVCKNNKKLNSFLVYSNVLLSIVNDLPDSSAVYQNKKRIKRYPKERIDSPRLICVNPLLKYKCSLIILL